MNRLRLALVSASMVLMLASAIGILGSDEPPAAAAQAAQLTAAFNNVPASHDGKELRFNVTFTPEPDLSYKTLRDHAFSVTGGTVIKAKRVQRGSNVGWTIVVVPELDSNENPAGPITIVLPPTTDCTAESAICTSGDVPLSSRTEATIPVSTEGPDRPGRPQNVTATQGPDIGEITLRWTEAQVTGDSNAAVRGYRVRRICGDETRTIRLDSGSRSFVIRGIDRSTTCRLNVAAHNDGGYGLIAWAGSESTKHPPMNPPEAPASITVTPDPDSDGTKVSWTAPGGGDAPDSYQISYWDITVAKFQYTDHSNNTDLEAVIAVAPANLRTVAVRGRLEGVGYRDRGVLGSWAVGWHESAIPSRLDAMTQSSSLSLSLTYSDDDGTAGKEIELSDDVDLICSTLSGLYMHTPDNTAWIADPCSKRVHVFDIGSDGALTHNVDRSRTPQDLFVQKNAVNYSYAPMQLWSDGTTLWLADRGTGRLVPYQLPKGKIIEKWFIMSPFRPEFGHSYLASAAVWSDGDTAWVVDAMIDQQIFAVKLASGSKVPQPQDLFVPSAFDACYIPEHPRASDVMPSATCSDQTALRDALDDPKYDEVVGAYSDGRWLWVAVDYYKDANKAGRLLAFNLLSGERASSRDIVLPDNIKEPVGMWSDGENLWLVDGGVERLYTFAIPASTSQQQRVQRMANDPANKPATGVPTISGTVQVGQTLTVSTSGVSDGDGTNNAAFSYQWLADGTDISGATESSYELTDSELNKGIKVMVYFTDDAGNAESLTSAATGAVAAKPFGLDDLDVGSGQTVSAKALVEVGNRGRKNNESQDRAWYAADTTDWHASGELRDGSLAWNNMTLTRVVYFSETGVFRFNEADDVHIGDSFADGGVNREATIWIQTETAVVSFAVKHYIRNSGSGWINFNTPVSHRSVLDGVSVGDLVIIAVSVAD